MAVDSRLKRQSATCMAVPSMLSGVFPETSGIVQAERQAAAWMYSGISAAAPAAATAVAISGVNVITGEYVYIIGTLKNL